MKTPKVKREEYTKKLQLLFPLCIAKIISEGYYKKDKIISLHKKC